MSYYRRGYSWEIIEGFPAPTGGWNPLTPDAELPTNQATQLDNFLIRPGKIMVRGGFDVYTDFTQAQPLAAQGIMIGLPDWCLISRKAISSTQYIDPWNMHKWGATGGTKQSLGNTTLLWRTPLGGTTTVQTLAVTRDQIPGPRWINYNNLLYGLGYDSADALIPVTGQAALAVYYVRPTKLLTVPFSQIAPVAPTVVANAPLAAVDLKEYYDRLFLLGGSDPLDPTKQVYTATIYFSQPLAALAGVAADWEDPIDHTTNQITIDYDTSDPGVALARSRSGLVIFRRWSIWILRGSSPTSFSLHLTAKETGCIDARSVVETDHGIYFLSHKGLMMTDGITVRDVSGTVKNQMHQAIQIHMQAAQNGWGAHASCALASDGAILVSIGVYDPAASGSLIPTWCGMYDPSTQTWIRITSPIWAADGTVYGTNNYPGLLTGPVDSSARMFAVGDKYLTRIEDLPNGKSAFRYPGLFDKMADGTYASIPAVWRSRLLRMVGQRKKMQIKRMFVDYVFQGTSLPANLGFQVVATDSTGTQLPGATSVTAGTGGAGTQGFVSSPTGAENEANPHSQYVNLDLPVEATNLSFFASWSAPTQGTDVGPLVFPELHGVGFELQPTSDKRK